MGDPFIRHIALLGFEKRFVPSQHYVYVFLVKWQDLSEKVVYRRFTEIYEFHEMFPIEAGDITPENRIIPHLPAPRWFDGQRVAESRQGTLTEYCNSLMNLPGKISRCPHLLNFFKVRPDDLKLPTDSQVKKPETYLMPRDGKSNAADITGPIILQTYRAIADYEKSSGSEMALATGDVVDVVEKSQSGWWFCQMKTKRGWVPASYLEPLDSPEEAEDPEPNYAGEPYVTIKAYTALLEDEMSLEQGETIEERRCHRLLPIHVPATGRAGHRPGPKPDQEGSAAPQVVHPQRAQHPPTVTEAPQPGHLSAQQCPFFAAAPPPGAAGAPEPKEPADEERWGRAGGAGLSWPCPPGEEEEPPKTERPKPQPAVPPRPSADLILHRCSESTKRKLASSV
eukprot:bmy_00388T0